MSASLSKRVSAVVSSSVSFEDDDASGGGGGGGGGGIGGECLSSLSVLFPTGSNTPANRRRIHSLLSQRHVTHCQSVISATAPVVDDIGAIERSLSALIADCAQCLRGVDDMSATNAALVALTGAVLSERAATERHSAIAAAFLNRFRLSADDVAALSSDRFDDRFFVALARIAAIRAECHSALTAHVIQSHLLDKLNEQLEAAYSALFEWTQRQTASMTEITPRYVTAMALLRAVPVYYEHAVNEVTSTRRLQLVTRFMRAQTFGDGGARPIELFADSPTRYVSDMFAWIHTAVATETEFLQTLFDATDNAAPALALAAVTATGASAAAAQHERRSQLTTIFDGLARALRVRVESSVSAVDSLETAYAMWNVTRFYADNIGALFGPTSSFTSLLRSLTELCRHSFFDSIRLQRDRIISAPPEQTRDLSPPQVITELIAQLSVIIGMIQANMNQRSDADGETSAILTAMIDPIIECAKATATAAALDESDRDVLMINVHVELTSALQTATAGRSKSEVVALAAAETADALVQRQSDAVLAKSGLLSALTAVQQWDRANSPISAIDALAIPTLTTAVRSFYSTLFSGGSFVGPSVDRILNGEMRQRCRHNIAVRIAQSYQTIYAAVTDGYGADAAQRIMTRTPTQIAALIEVNDTAKL